MKKLRGERKQDAAGQAKFCGVAAAMIGSAVVGAGASAYSANKNAKAAESSSQSKVDPHINDLLFGAEGSNGGLLNKFSGYADTPQSQPLKNYGTAAGDYLDKYGSSDMTGVRNAANGLMAGQSAPTTATSAWAVGNQIQAPNQNGIDLSGSYKSLLGGGDTTALNNSMNAAVNATNAGYKTNLDNLTNTLQRSVLPGISQNAVLAGQYGGSRQGVAQGNAIIDFTNQMNNANTQLSATNSANTTAQAASAYQQGQDRALAATQGLGAQQYGVAAQNAATKNQAEFMNVGNVQQSNLANQGAQLQTNAQNNGAAIAGAGLLGGQSGTAYTAATNDQNYAMNQAKGVTSLLAPFVGVNGSSTSTQPLYSNVAGGLLGGAATGLSLYNQYKQSNNNSVPSSGSYASNDWLSS